MPAGTTFTRRLVKLDGQNRIDLLAQDCYWADQHGNIKRLEKLEPDHRRNLYDYLLRNANRLRTCAERQLQEQWAESAGDAPNLQGVKADDWILSQPLMQRLTELIAADSGQVA